MSRQCKLLCLVLTYLWLDKIVTTMRACWNAKKIPVETVKWKPQKDEEYKSLGHRSGVM